MLFLSRAAPNRVTKLLLSMPMPTPIRILVADDHELFRRGLTSLLATRPEWVVCGEAVDGDDAVEKARRLKPDIAILDISMPKMNGLDAARIIRKVVPETEVLMLSQYPADVMLPVALGAGARGYVCKSNVARDLLTALQDLARRLPAHAGASERYALVWPHRGEMAGLVDSMDWSKTSLGPAEAWPQSLRSPINIMLASKAQIVMFAGPDLLAFYNDAYIPVFGSKHPWALGKPARECWAEIWDVLGALFQNVIDSGESFHAQDHPFFLERHGYSEETFFDVSYDPLRDEANHVSGIFCIVSETTAQVFSERRMRTLRDVAARTLEARTIEQALTLATHVLRDNPRDVPFAACYVLEEQSGGARLVSHVGFDAESPLHPAVVPASEFSAWSFDTVLSTGRAAPVEKLRARFGAVACGPYPEPPDRAVALPITPPGRESPTAILVAGLSPRLQWTNSYRGFFDILAATVTTSVAKAIAFEEERKRAAALAEIDRAKTAFFSNVSHEFRTPLALMLGPLEDTLARADSRLNPQERSQLQMARRNSLRLLKLVNSLLDFSRIEAGRMQAIYRPTDLAHLTAEVASNFRSAIEKAGLHFRVECAALEEPIYVDCDMWEKIVLNLLSNAYKFTFAGEIQLTLRAAGNSAELTVRDTGAGIAEEQLPRVFERFHRVEGARGRTHEGTGIGLALVQELVKLHGGAITVHSQVDHGTEFVVRIPRGKDHLPADHIESVLPRAASNVRADAYTEEALRWLPDESTPAELAAADATGDAPRGEAHPQPAAAGDRELILLADDNADMRGYVRSLLSKQYRVHAVSNGADALAALRETNPDLILLDVMMPGMDGFAVLRAIRTDPSARGKPVIVLSARAGEEARVAGLNAGADDYLAKPFSGNELLARVRTHLARARVRQEDLEQFRNLAESIPQLTWMANPDGWTFWFNQRWYEYTGATRDQLVGWGWQSVHHPAVLPAALEKWNSSLQSGEPFEMEISLRAADGNFNWFLSRVAPVRDRSGKVLRWFGTNTNIMLRKQTEEELKRSHAELEARVNERTAELKTLTGRILQTQDDERRRMARELHDSSGQLVVALSLNLAVVESRAAQMDAASRRALSESVAMLVELSKELRTVSYLLHPPLLDESGLKSAVRTYVDGFAERCSIQVDLDIPPDLGRFSRDIETAIFRIIQECLTNIHRHSGSATAAIQISADAQEVGVRVRDRGKGMPAAGPQRPLRVGVGIQGMTERVALLGGSLVIRSQSDGTEVLAVLPLGDGRPCAHAGPEVEAATELRETRATQTVVETAAAER